MTYACRSAHESGSASSDVDDNPKSHAHADRMQKVCVMQTVHGLSCTPDTSTAVDMHQGLTHGACGFVEYTGKLAVT